jgi:hypothetical protein
MPGDELLYSHFEHRRNAIGEVDGRERQLLARFPLLQGYTSESGRSARLAATEEESFEHFDAERRVHGVRCAERGEIGSGGKER